MAEPIELVGNALCLDFANTVNARPEPSRDWLTSQDGALAWAVAAGLAAVPAPSGHAAGALTGLRSLRECIYEVFAAIALGDPPPPEPLSDVVRDYAASVPHARWRRQDDRLVAEWPALRTPEIAWPVCTSAVDLLTRGPLDRVGRCPRCRWLFLDVSRNGQRRWCRMATCGSRDKAARYLAKSRARA